MQLDRSFVLTDANVRAAVPEVSGARLLALPPGEGTKNFDSYRAVIDWLANQQAKRSANLIAVGGGVVGDLGGFAAASYMRGIRLTMVPTSLLAMVDSSVGGKTGIDLPQGKNLVGAFYPPSEVILCLDLLSTLPERHIRNGAAEVLKYGFIMRPSILPDAQAALRTGDWSSVVPESISCKKEVVEEDEIETTGRRAILNFGHTVGHAIEALLGYEYLLHGEAISIGMSVEARLGEALGITATGTASTVDAVLSQAGLPITHAALAEAERLVELMRLDKKAGSSLAMSLLTSIGDCRLVRDVPEAAVIAALQAACG